MILLPPGFDVAQLLVDFFNAAGPFVSLAAVFGLGFFAVRLLTGRF
jgi:hypothetical protein